MTSKAFKEPMVSVFVVLISVILACQLKEFKGVGKVGLQLVVNTIFSLMAFRSTICLIPKVKSMFLSKLKGVDKGRAGKVELPEALGVISGSIFLITLFTYIPVPYLSLKSSYLYLPVLRLKMPILALSLNSEEMQHDEFASMLAALLSICCMLFLGFVDDVLDLRWKHKLLFPAFGSLPLLVVYAVTYNMTTVLLPKPFYFSIDLGIFYYVYMLMLAIFCTNAINILAGVNGLETGQSAVIAVSIIIFNLVELSGDQWRAHLFSLNFMLPFLAVTSGLLYHNWYPADVFVGDTYCYFAGMTFAVVGILGHFSKTMVLFFIPQVFNFLLSMPQLFKLVPCPRHRLPKFDPETNLMNCSTLTVEINDISSLGLKCLQVLKALKLTREKRIDERTLEYTNLTIINLALFWFGPRTQKSLTIVLLVVQAVFCCIAFLIRYVLVKYVY